MGFNYQAVELNMGSLFIGVILSATLLGLCYTQAFFYYAKYPRDPWYYHWLARNLPQWYNPPSDIAISTQVGAIILFDSVHQVAITRTVYYYLVTNYNRPQELEMLDWSVGVGALFTTVTEALIQCFYVTRVWRLSNKCFLLTGIVSGVVGANAALGTVWFILATRFRTYDDLLTISHITMSINTLSTASNCLIAGSLCFLLYRARTGFKNTDGMIKKLMIFIVNTGVLTSICSIADLLAMLISPRTLVYASFYFCVGRLYTNAFLATLNARQSPTSSPLELSQLMAMPHSMLSTVNGSASQKASQGISIRIERTTTSAYADLGQGSQLSREKDGVEDEDFCIVETAQERRPQSMDKGAFAI